MDGGLIFALALMSIPVAAGVCLVLYWIALLVVPYTPSRDPLTAWLASSIRDTPDEWRRTREYYSERLAHESGVRIKISEYDGTADVTSPEPVDLGYWNGKRVGRSYRRWVARDDKRIRDAAKIAAIEKIVGKRA